MINKKQENKDDKKTTLKEHTHTHTQTHTRTHTGRGNQQRRCVTSRQPILTLTAVLVNPHFLSCYGLMSLRFVTTPCYLKLSTDAVACGLAHYNAIHFPFFFRGGAPPFFFFLLYWNYHYSFLNLCFPCF